MQLPNDPVMLMCLLNTRLRDGDGNLDEVCAALEVDRAAVEERLREAGFVYCEARRQFR